MKTLGLKWISVALFAGAILFAGCGSSSSNGTGGTGGSPAATVSFSGIAWAFELPGAPYGRISGAKVSILEMPELETTTNAEGEFTIEGLHVGSQATLVLEHESHPLTYTKTHTVPDTDLDDVTFQIPTNFLFGLIESGLVDGGVIDGIDPNKCQVVSTFTRFGKTIGDSGHHGEPGAILSVAPANNAEAGPIYFGDDVIPDPTRAYSSLDGRRPLNQRRAGRLHAQRFVCARSDRLDCGIPARGQRRGEPALPNRGRAVRVDPDEVPARRVSERVAVVRASGSRTGVS
jgi:hypothetical protein